MTSDQKHSLIDYLSGFINANRRELLLDTLARRTLYITVVLEDIHYPQNASAVLRSCECLGIQTVHVVENHNRYRINPDVVRGASKWIELQRYNTELEDNTATCLAGLRANHYKIAAMTPYGDAIAPEQLPLDTPIALCFGSEENGLSDTVLANADYRVRIPMQGFTQSFNISVSAGIALYVIAERLRRSAIKWQLPVTHREEILIDWLTKSTPNGKRLQQTFIQQLEDIADREYA